MTVSGSNAVSFKGVARHFGTVRAVDNVNLDIAEGEFFAMLGPSGSGKTTCLRLIAGFEQPTAGGISIFGFEAQGVPPYRRSVNTVFQDYALFPHMSVLDNVAYGLMVKGVARNVRYKKANETLNLVALGSYGERKPAQLSGGQRQRVALARALINEPRVLLLDEPLGALDLKLREQMQVELKTLQRQLGITFVFVTHDQGEALSMADRVAIFNHGQIVQVGTPEEVYNRPRNRFVADFVGSSNVLSPAFCKSLGLQEKWASLRPENMVVTHSTASKPKLQQTIEGQVVSVHYQGAATRLHIVTQRGNTLTAVSSKNVYVAGDVINLSWRDSSLHYLDDAL